MSRFYADISGGRGTATRQGHAASGIRGHVRGWNSGVLVIGEMDGNDGTTDQFWIYQTGGSSGAASDTLLGVVRVDGNGDYYFELR
jgi:hypothetical protein